MFMPDVTHDSPLSLRLFMALITAIRSHGDYGLTITDAAGNSMITDIPAEQGGAGKGIRPMQSLLAALLGCSSVDIVSILKKQKQDITHFRMEADGDREPGKEPSLWKTIRLTFYLSGQIDPAKAYRATVLSMDKYCSVAETLRRAGADISFTLIVNDIPYQP
jgi:putative redox protein